jgi:signal transduction histidine kinase
MGLTWYLGVDAIAIVLATVLGAWWLLRHRAASTRAHRFLEDRLRFETLLSDLFAQLVHVETGGLDAALEGALRQMVSFLGVDRGNLDEYVEGAPGIRVSWAAPGIEKLPSVLAVSEFAWTAETLRRGGIVRFSRTEELPEAAALDRTCYERLGTRSHLSIPLHAGGPMLGVLSFDSVSSRREWPDDVTNRLLLLSEVFAAALERKRIELSLAERLHFQRLLSDLSARFSGSSVLDFDDEVHGALRSIVDFLGVDHATLIEFPRRDVPARSWTIGEATDATRVPWLILRLREGDVVHVSRLADLPDEAVTDRRSCLAFGVRSLAAMPLRAGGVVIGGLVLAAGSAERGWPRELIEQLYLFGEVVANALAWTDAEREAGRLRQELTHIGRVSAMGELTASLAHELNQPLTAILNNAQVAQKYLEADAPNLGELREILSDIVADDQRAADVIHRLRALLKKGALEYVPLNVNDVVDGVARLVRSDMVIRNVPMTLDLTPGLPNVCGDRVQLQQVVLNMVLNGVEAMGEPNGRPHALVIRTSRAGAEAVGIAVEDSGTGIDVKALDRLFEPLYTTKAEGLGMGLAIARTIVAAHGGRLHASNNAGGGATFQFTLPIAAERSR